MEENSSAEKEGSGEILAVSDRTQCIVDILYVQSDENYLQRFDPDLTMGKLSDVEADVLEILLDKERSHLILKALNRINPKYKPVLQLWALGDLTQKEIAEVLDINYNSARIYVVRGLKALKEEYFKLERGVRRR